MKREVWRPALLFALLVTLLGVDQALAAAPGELDPSFGQGGLVRTYFSGVNRKDAARALALQPDGKIVAVGEFYDALGLVRYGTYGFAVARYNGDGSPDSSFDRGLGWNGTRSPATIGSTPYSMPAGLRTYVLRATILPSQPQAISWFFRIASLYFFLEAFGLPASIHNALLAQVVDSLATLFPATPGGAGASSIGSGGNASSEQRSSTVTLLCPVVHFTRARTSDAIDLASSSAHVRSARATRSGQSLGLAASTSGPPASWTRKQE